MYWRMCYNVKGAKCRKDRKIMAVIYENKVKELGKDIMMMNGGDFQTCLACNRIQFSGPQTSHIML